MAQKQQLELPAIPVLPLNHKCDSIGSKGETKLKRFIADVARGESNKAMLHAKSRKQMLESLSRWLSTSRELPWPRQDDSRRALMGVLAGTLRPGFWAMTWASSQVVTTPLKIFA